MAQIQILIDIIKKQLKAQGKNYNDVANVLDLSEASVKRLFAQNNFTLQRIEIIANFLGFELSELMILVEKQEQQLTQLKMEQEKEIASDIVLLLVTVCIMNGYTLEEILNDYHISKTECIQKFAKLDKLKIIELLPNNRIKLLISPNFKWLSRGPIQRFFQHKVQQEFFKSNFDKATEQLNVANGMLSPDSIKVMQNKMRRLVKDFNQLALEDKSRDMQDKMGITLVLAERHWNYSIFENYRKK